MRFITTWENVLPEDMNYVISNSKLSEDFDISSTHMVLINSNLPAKSIHKMTDEMEQIDGVKYVLGLESVVGSRVPEEIIPESISGILKSDRWGAVTYKLGIQCCKR